MKRIYLIRSNSVDSPPTYTSDHPYITWEAAANLSYFTRTLPLVPLDCPTPLGIWGKQTLPDAQLLVDKLFTRDKFIPDPIGSNGLFIFFAQHFMHQFFKTDFKRGHGFQWGGHGIDVSLIYGQDKGSENILRSFKVGKLRTQMSHHNHHSSTLHVAKWTIEHGRELRYQSFNQYQKRFDLPPTKSFLELTGDETLAKDLEELYGDIDGVEFYVGLMMEKLRPRAIFGASIIEIGGPFSVKGLMSNPICSPRYWKPSTFGGETGFDIINTASLKKLFCQNMKGECPENIAFRVPDYVEGDVAEEVKNCCKRDKSINESVNKNTEL